MHTSHSTEKDKPRLTGIFSMEIVSFVIQLSTTVVAILLLLAGDVERNPGPPPSNPNSDPRPFQRNLENSYTLDGDAMTLHTTVKIVNQRYINLYIYIFSASTMFVQACSNSVLVNIS